jgi:hypothetical protein
VVAARRRRVRLAAEPEPDCSGRGSSLPPLLKLYIVRQPTIFYDRERRLIMLGYPVAGHVTEGSSGSTLPLTKP